MAEEVRTQVPGNIWKVQVKQGDTVAAGDLLFIMEVMKTEVEHRCETAGYCERRCNRRGPGRRRGGPGGGGHQLKTSAERSGARHPCLRAKGLRPLELTPCGYALELSGQVS